MINMIQSQFCQDNDTNIKENSNPAICQLTLNQLTIYKCQNKVIAGTSDSTITHHASSKIRLAFPFNIQEEFYLSNKSCSIFMFINFGSNFYNKNLQILFVLPGAHKKFYKYIPCKFYRKFHKGLLFRQKKIQSKHTSKK